MKARDVRGKIIYTTEERKKFLSSTKEKKREYMRTYFLKNPWMKHLDLSRSRCKNCKYYFGIKNTLTKDEIKRLWFRDKAWDLEIPSLNRIEGKNGYSFDNCEFIELSINQSIGNIGNKHAVRVWTKEQREKHSIILSKYHANKRAEADILESKTEE